MTEQPSIEQRIAEVLGDHESYYRRGHRDWECGCGKIFGLKVNLDYHVASVLVASLGLTQEQHWGLGVSGD